MVQSRAPEVVCSDSGQWLTAVVIRADPSACRHLSAPHKPDPHGMSRVMVRPSLQRPLHCVVDSTTAPSQWLTGVVIRADLPSMTGKFGASQA